MLIVLSPLSGFLIKSFHRKVYVCVEEHIFLFHVHASTEHLLGLVVAGNIHWGCGVESAIYPEYSFFRCSEQPMMTLVTMDFQEHMQPSSSFLLERNEGRHQKALQNVCNMPTTQTRECEIREENLQAITSTHGFYLHGLNR